MFFLEHHKVERLEDPLSHFHPTPDTFPRLCLSDSWYCELHGAADDDQPPEIRCVLYSAFNSLVTFS